MPSNTLAVSVSQASVVASASILKDQGYDYTLPLTPHYSAKVTTTNQGPTGFLLDGAALYNPYEANHSTVATSDSFIATAHGATASFLDDCDGHPGPGGQYHYHGLPTCLVSYATGDRPRVRFVTSISGTSTAAVVEDDRAAREPVILGYAFDGYGIDDNVAMSGATTTVSSLDACNGIFSPVPGDPDGLYHYVLENVKGGRSSIGCLHGSSRVRTRTRSRSSCTPGTRRRVRPRSGARAVGHGPKPGGERERGHTSSSDDHVERTHARLLRAPSHARTLDRGKARSGTSVVGGWRQSPWRSVRSKERWNRFCENTAEWGHDLFDELL